MVQGFEGLGFVQVATCFRTQIEHDGRAEEHGEAHKEEGALIVAGEVFCEADEVGSEKAADHADHVDGGDACGGGSALEEASGDGPEGALHSVVGDDDGAYGGYDADWICREAAGEEAGRDEKDPGDD